MEQDKTCSFTGSQNIDPEQLKVVKIITSISEVLTENESKAIVILMDQSKKVIRAAFENGNLIKDVDKIIYRLDEQKKKAA